MKALPKHPVLITAERVQMSIRARFNPIPALTPPLVAAWLESFRLGFFRNIALAWDAMERRDYTLAVVAPKRKKAAARLGWEILTVNDSPPAREQKLALEYFYNHLTATNALEENETGGFSLLVRQMMDAVGKRYAVHEIVWQPGVGANRLTATFRFCPLWWFEGTQGRLRFLPSEFAIYGVDMEPGGWLVTVGDGIMEACSVAYVFKHLPLRDWLNYSEKFGMPGVLQYDGSLTLQERDVSGQVTPGNLLNLAGGNLAEWSTMNAQVQTITESLDNGTTLVEFGPPKHLGAGELVDLLRVNRSRTFFHWPTLQTSGVGGGAESVGLGDDMPEKNSSSTPGFTQSQVVSNYVDGSGPNVVSQIGQPGGLAAFTHWTPAGPFAAVEGLPPATAGSITISTSDIAGGDVSGGVLVKLRKIPICLNGQSGSMYFLCSQFIPD